tara:strand:+ start:46 stop:429 length:384 start_codon:yes stop_codon:yes gene_type:complete
MTEWQYVRKNSKGEAVFRKDTEESLEFVMEYLNTKEIPFDVVYGASFMYIENRANRDYVYYWTTGRWSIKKRVYESHYYSDGIDDFVTRFLNKYADEQIAQRKMWDEEKAERIKRKEEKNALKKISK